MFIHTKNNNNLNYCFNNNGCQIFYLGRGVIYFTGVYKYLKLNDKIGLFLYRLLYQYDKF